MKSILLTVCLVFSLSNHVRSEGLLDSFLEMSPFRKDKNDLERMFGLANGSLDEALATSAMEIVGQFEFPPIQFVKRLHFRDETTCAYDLYAKHPNQTEAEIAWNKITEDISSRYGVAPLVKVPEKYMGDLSPYGENSIQLKIWANDEFAVLVRLWKHGTDAYIEISQNDLVAGTVVGLSDPEYGKLICSRYAGRLPEDFHSMKGVGGATSGHTPLPDAPHQPGSHLNDGSGKDTDIAQTLHNSASRPKPLVRLFGVGLLVVLVGITLWLLKPLFARKNNPPPSA